MNGIRAGLGRRSAGFFLALIAEGLLALLLLTFGLSDKKQEKPAPRLVSFESKPDAKQTPDPPERQPQKALQAERPAFQMPKPEPEQPTPQPAPSAVTMIPLSRAQMAGADIAGKSEAPAGKARMGPPDAGTSGDTARVGGSGPNGEPLYAAAWYREPYPDELDGYLSTASGPGWGLIACRTAPDFRVEDCVGLDEYPRGSNMNRAILAAAWQFRVRPPRIGGRSMVGEWVRIRIEMGKRR